MQRRDGWVTWPARRASAPRRPAGKWHDLCVNATERPVSGNPKQIWFGNGNSALVCREDGSEAGQLVAALGLEPDATGRPVLVVSGGADTLKGAQLDRAEEMLGPAVSAATRLAGAAVVDGGTSAGVMAVIGAARARRPEAMPVLLGVAPEGLVSYPGLNRDDGVPLDPQHTHFVLADSSEWGGETALLISVAAGLAGPGPVVMLLAGGGAVAKTDVLAAVRRGWPVFAVAGTGGLADDILARRDAARAGSRRPGPGPGQAGGSAGPAGDLDLREILSQGDIREVTGTPGTLARDLAWALQPEPVLKEAWREFATYDQLAKKLRATFTRAQAAILSLGVAATLVALLYNTIHSSVLHWLAVALPILVSVLIALASLACGRAALGDAPRCRRGDQGRDLPVPDPDPAVRLGRPGEAAAGPERAGGRDPGPAHPDRGEQRPAHPV